MEYIKLYFHMRQPAKMEEKLNELKAIPGELSLQALELVRYWGGISHG